MNRAISGSDLRPHPSAILAPMEEHDLRI